MDKPIDTEVLKNLSESQRNAIDKLALDPYFNQQGREDIFKSTMDQIVAGIDKLGAPIEDYNAFANECIEAARDIPSEETVEANTAKIKDEMKKIYSDETEETEEKKEETSA